MRILAQDTITLNSVANMNEQIKSVNNSVNNAQEKINIMNRHFWSDAEGVHVSGTKNDSNNGVRIDEKGFFYLENGHTVSGISEAGLDLRRKDGHPIAKIGRTEVLDEDTGEHIGWMVYRNIALSFRVVDGHIQTEQYVPIVLPKKGYPINAWLTIVDHKYWKQETYNVLKPNDVKLIGEPHVSGRGYDEQIVTITDSCIERFNLTENNTGFLQLSYISDTPQDSIVLFQSADMSPTVVLEQTYIEGYLSRGLGEFTHLNARHAECGELCADSVGYNLFDIIHPVHSIIWLELHVDPNKLPGFIGKWERRQMSLSSALSYNKVLDCTAAGTANGTNIQLYEYNKSLAQQWIWRGDAGDGYYCWERIS